MIVGSEMQSYRTLVGSQSHEVGYLWYGRCIVSNYLQD